MSISIRIKGQQVSLVDGELVFRGYVVQAGKLLRDESVAGVLTQFLKGNTPDKLFETINGSFLFIYKKNSYIFFSTDHVGANPLFYWRGNDSLDLTDNLFETNYQGKLSDKALCSLLAAGYTQGQDTIFEDVKECEPGTLYIYDIKTGKLEHKSWFRYVSTNEKDYVPEELDVLAKDLFPTTDRGEYTVSLSGGIDSRFLSASLMQNGISFQTYSFGSELNKDMHIAEQIAEHYSLKHQRHLFTPKLCARYFNSEDLGFILSGCTLGRSLPNETDLIPSRKLDSGQNIICKGFCGDGLAGSLINKKVMSLKTLDGMVAYLYHKYFNLTCISGKTFKDVILAQLKENSASLLEAHGGDYVSALEDWHLRFKQRKYIVNTMSFYTTQDYGIYLPFYDRRLMDYFAALKYEEKMGERAYFSYIKNMVFTGELAFLAELATSRQGFNQVVQVSAFKKLKKTLQESISKLDVKRLRKRLGGLSLSYYADTLMLFNHNFIMHPYLDNKVSYNFPEIIEVVDFLRQNGCQNAAAHVDWLAKQRTCQVSINGLAICKFFFNRQFIQLLVKHIA
jgi:hypothetical protein